MSVSSVAMNEMRGEKERCDPVYSTPCTPALFPLSLVHIAYGSHNDCALNTKNHFHHRVNQIACIYIQATDSSSLSDCLSVCRYLYTNIYLFRIFNNTPDSNGYIFNAEKNTLLPLNYHQFDKFLNILKLFQFKVHSLR